MSIAIVGGNDRMVQRYKETCKEYNCKAKVFTQPCSLKTQVGSPDLLILFTNTVSHKMVKAALKATTEKNVKVVRSHSSSLFALKNILEEHVA